MLAQKEIEHFEAIADIHRENRDLESQLLKAREDKVQLQQTIKSTMERHHDFMQFVAENILPNSETLSRHLSKLTMESDQEQEPAVSSSHKDIDYQSLLKDVETMKQETEGKKPKRSLDSIVEEVKKHIPNSSYDEILSQIRQLQLQNNGTFKGLTIRSIIDYVLTSQDS